MPNINLPTVGELNWGTKTLTAISAVNDAVDAIPSPTNVYSATSTSSQIVSTGTKTFVVVAGKGWTVGQRLRFANTVTPTTFVEGVVTAYSGTNLTVTVDTTAGTGTIATWTINVTGQPGKVEDSQALDLYWSIGNQTWDSIPAGTSTTRPINWWSLNDSTAPQPPDALTRSTWFKRD